MAAVASAPPLSHEQLGVLAVDLALTFPVWIRRRKTSFTYIDDTTIRQRQSIDFRLPARETLPLRARPAEAERIYVPLYIADKESLVKFSVTDEAGEALSLLNTVENGGLATAGLNAIVNGLSGRPDRARVQQNSLRSVIHSIVTAPGDRGPGVAASALARERPLGSVLSRDDVYRALVTDLARGFLMLVSLPYEPERDRCVKIEHQTRQSWDPDGLETAVARGIARVTSSLAITDKVQGFTELQIGWARGTHFEVEAPEDVVLGEATLDCVQWDPAHRRSVRIDGRRTVFDRPAVDLNVAPRVNYDPQRDSERRRGELLQCRQDTAAVVLRLRPRSAPVLVPVTIASLLTSALLWSSLARLGDLDGQTSAALLLLFPAVIAAFLARPGEHAFATRLLAGVRWTTLLVSACAVVAVGVIGGGFVRGDPPPTVSTTRCEGALPGARARAGADRAVRLTCEQIAPAAVRGPVDARALRAVGVAAGISTLLAAILACALAITWRVGRRRHAATDTESRRATELDGMPIARRP